MASPNEPGCKTSVTRGAVWLMMAKRQALDELEEHGWDGTGY